MYQAGPIADSPPALLHTHTVVLSRRVFFLSAYALDSRFPRAAASKASRTAFTVPVRLGRRLPEFPFVGSESPSLMSHARPSPGRATLSARTSNRQCSVNQEARGGCCAPYCCRRFPAKIPIAPSTSTASKLPSSKPRPKPTHHRARQRINRLDTCRHSKAIHHPRFTGACRPRQGCS